MTPVVACRVAACRLPGSSAWDFFLVNDSETPLDATLHRVGYEWGNLGHSEPADVRIRQLPKGAHELIWHDDGDGVELRMELAVRVHAEGRDVELVFEFPILYKKTELPIVRGLNRPGWEAPPAGS